MTTTNSVRVYTRHFFPVLELFFLNYLNIYTLKNLKIFSLLLPGGEWDPSMTNGRMKKKTIAFSFLTSLRRFSYTCLCVRVIIQTCSPTQLGLSKLLNDTRFSFLLNSFFSSTFTLQADRKYVGTDIPHHKRVEISVKGKQCGRKKRCISS